MVGVDPAAAGLHRLGQLAAAQKARLEAGAGLEDGPAERGGVGAAHRNHR